tara:strand:+ start:93 stop:731 length:639 start_codon:yes stop_codon:yes gene_type:complete
MARNISDFENIALPPKKQPPHKILNPVLKVDATSKESWTLVDIETGKTRQIKDPEENQELLKNIAWDLGFQRTKIITNSGATNPEGKVKALDLGPVDFDSVKDIPSKGYVKDQRKWGKILNPALSNWYNYRTRTHNVESKKNVYLIKTARGIYAKFKILNYYCTHEETDCSSVMCDRNEAACLTIEYVMQKNNSFPLTSTSSQNSFQKAALP